MVPPTILEVQTAGRTNTEQNEEQAKGKNTCTHKPFADSLAVDNIRKHIARQAAQKIFNLRHCHSSLQFYDCNTVSKISPSEIIKNRCLGEGAHAVVYEGLANPETPSALDLTFDKLHKENQERGSKNKTHTTSSLPLFAMKMVHPSILAMGTDHLIEAIVNIATEVRYLNALDHPNIVKLHGVSKPGLFHEDCFLIMDRLHGTLTHRLHEWTNMYRSAAPPKSKHLRPWRRKWRKIREENSFLSWLPGRRGKREMQEPCMKGTSSLKSLWSERLLISRDLASALSYMHSRRIIHRDIKPDNMGFDADGRIQLFDFGLARELPGKKINKEHETDINHSSTRDDAFGEARDNNDLHSQEEVTDRDELYKMTALLGSPRYMAPELGRSEPYNESCDVYSFAVLLWEIVHLQLPFAAEKIRSLRELQDYVWSGPKLRPSLVPKGVSSQVFSPASELSPSLEDTLREAWSPCVNARPRMSTIALVLEEEYQKTLHLCWFGTLKTMDDSIWEVEDNDSI